MHHEIDFVSGQGGNAAHGGQGRSVPSPGNKLDKVAENWAGIKEWPPIRAEVFGGSEQRELAGTAQHKPWEKGGLCWWNKNFVLWRNPWASQRDPLGSKHWMWPCTGMALGGGGWMTHGVLSCLIVLKCNDCCNAKVPRVKWALMCWIHFLCSSKEVALSVHNQKMKMSRKISSASGS